MPNEDQNQHISRRESFFESLRAYFLGMIILKALGFVKGVAFARLLGPEEYGKFILLFGILAICEPIVLVGIPAVFMRFAPRFEQSDGLKYFFSRMFAVALGGAAIGSIVLIAGADWIATHLLKDPKLSTGVIIVGFALLPFGAFHLFYTAFQGLRRYFVSVTAQNLQLLFLIGTGVFLILFRPTYQAPLLAFALACLAVDLLFLSKFVSMIKERSTKESQADAHLSLGPCMRFGLWMLLVDGGYELFRYTDKFFLNALLSPTEVGIYSVAFTFAGTALFVGILFGETLMPHISAKFDQGREYEAVKIINTAIKGALITLANLIAVAALFRHEIITLLYGQEFAESAIYLPALLVYFALFSVHLILMIYVYLFEKPSIGLISILAGAALIGLGAVSLIPLFHVPGAVASALIGVSALLFVNLLLAKRLDFELDPRLYALLALLVVAAFGTTWAFILILAVNLPVIFTNLIFGREEKRVIKKMLLSLRQRI